MTAPRRVVGGRASSGSSRAYVLVFALVLVVLGLGLVGVFSLCRESVSQSGARAADTARSQPPPPPAASSFPPPLPPTPTPTLVASPRPVAASPTVAVTTGRKHTVQAGDTPSGIAQRYSVDVDNLLRVNGLTRTSLLQIGQELTIPDR